MGGNKTVRKPDCNLVWRQGLVFYPGARIVAISISNGFTPILRSVVRVP